MDQQQTGIQAQVLGRITKARSWRGPWRGGQLWFTVATSAGPASRPLVKSIYVKGDPALAPSDDLPVRIVEKLGVGDLDGSRQGASAPAQAPRSRVHRDRHRSRGRAVEAACGRKDGGLSAAVVHCRQAPYDIYVGQGRDPASGARGNHFRTAPVGFLV